MKHRGVTWKSLMMDVVGRMPRTFTLRDIERHREFFAKHYPDNRFIDAKIRQSLQILRDQGFVRFLGNGTYETTATPPVFSAFFDPSVGANYASKAQIARVTVETWAEHNLYCLNCVSDELARLADNTPIADFECESCSATYQVKAKNGRFHTSIAGAAYAPTLRALRDGTLPNYVLVEYDPRFSIVVFVSGIPGAAFREDSIVARKPLPITARRAGWQGCSLNIEGLPQVRIVEPAGLAKQQVRLDWRAAAG
jgi:type II restriction enzyme